MNLLRPLCWLGLHRYRVTREIAPHWRKLGCARCPGVWSMHDPTQTLNRWDREDEAMSRAYQDGKLNLHECITPARPTMPPPPPARPRLMYEISPAPSASTPSASSTGGRD